MPVKTSRKERSARVSRTDPHHLPDEQFAAKQTAREDNSPSAKADQLIRHAADAVRDALAAVKGNPDALPLAVRVDIAGLSAALAFKPSPRTLTLKEAAFRAGRSEQVVACWCLRFSLGWKIAGRWVVDATKLDAFLTGDRS